jgi:Tfp pilus assembly protein PilE
VRDSRGGYSLVKLLGVIMTLGILAAITVPTYNHFINF